MTAHAEWAAQKRATAGLPTLTCPNCGKTAAHWIPDSLDDDGYYPGYFTCKTTERQPE